MSVSLIPGANAPVPTGLISVLIKAGKEADISSFRLFIDGKTKTDSDFVFYGQKVNDDETVKFIPQGLSSVFEVNLSRLHKDVQKIAFSATVDSGSISGLGTLSIAIASAGNTLIDCEVPMVDRNEAALILGELYRRNSEWKFRFISQGFNGGLQPLAEHFGVDICDTTQSSNPEPRPAPPVNLSKVSLTKDKPSVSLEKKSGSFGLIKVNLNWNQRQTKGFLGGLFGGNNGVDLDLGAFVEMNDGQKVVIQALGNAFGNLNTPPFIKLQGDDRTGAVSGGEWLHINGEYWDHIRQVLIYAFIYEGAPNWDSTDGKVSLFIPNQPEIQTSLTEGNSSRGMCAIARLTNERGQLKVERINQYFSGHSDMDKAFRWGFRWKAGSK